MGMTSEGKLLVEITKPVLDRSRFGTLELSGI